MMSPWCAAGSGHRSLGPERRCIRLNYALRLVMFLFAVYGTYKTARTALRLGAELFG
jgi:hypothetical protein